jgi:transposase
MHKADAISQLLATIPGIGPIIALTLAIEVDPAAFESGRHLAAWIQRNILPAASSALAGAGHERLRQLPEPPR